MLTYLIDLVNKLHFQLVHGVQDIHDTLDQISPYSAPVAEQFLRDIPVLMDNLNLLHDRALARLAGAQEEDLGFSLVPLSVARELPIDLQRLRPLQFGIGRHAHTHGAQVAAREDVEYILDDFRGCP